MTVVAEGSGCPHCPSRFMSRVELEEHVATKHPAIVASVHPVDAFVQQATRAGFTIDPEWEKQMRAICDEPIEELRKR